MDGEVVCRKIGYQHPREFAQFLDFDFFVCKIFIFC